MKRKTAKNNKHFKTNAALDGHSEIDDVLCAQTRSCSCAFCHEKSSFSNSMLHSQQSSPTHKRKNIALNTFETPKEQALPQSLPPSYKNSLVFCKPPYPTNFEAGQKANNAYSFILMHLRNQDSKNPTNVLIPETCLFEAGEAIDLLYSSSQGHIRSMKYGREEFRLRKKDIYKHFKQLYKLPDTKENNMGRFAQDEFLLLSDQDLQQVCYKGNLDPFWTKLQYLQRKLPTGSEAAGYKPIVSVYDIHINPVPHIHRMATANMAGFLSEQQALDQLDEDSYLTYLNIKICGFLKLKHNIKILYCDFQYLKVISAVQNRQHYYYFVNAANLKYENLTPAIKRREQRLKAQEQARNTRLILTREREHKIKHFETSPNVPKLQSHMYEQFEQKLQELDIYSIKFQQDELVRNQAAFEKLHPGYCMGFKELLNRKSFYLRKDQILGKNQRRGLILPSRNRMFSFFQSNKILQHKEQAKAASSSRRNNHQPLKTEKFQRLATEVPSTKRGSQSPPRKGAIGQGSSGKNLPKRNMSFRICVKSKKSNEFGPFFSMRDDTAQQQ